MQNRSNASWLYFLFLFIFYVTIITLVYHSIELLEWRHYNITLPHWKNYLTIGNWWNRVAPKTLQPGFPTLL